MSDRPRAPIGVAKPRLNFAPIFFVRDAESRGWVWQGDLPDDKRAAIQARIDEHDRKVKGFYADRREAGRLIDIDTCEESWWFSDDSDPYGIELAPYEQISRNSFVRNKGSTDWVLVNDLPTEKIRALRTRGERERSAREHVVEDIFNALRHGDDGLATAVTAIAKAEKSYGKQIVKDALGD